jgi:CubicO group peptidase (beta-lactamase class C family)
MKQFSFLMMMIFCCVATQSFSQYNFDGVTKKFENSTSQFGKEFAVLISKDDKIIYDKKFGKEFDKRTQAPIASTSMWLTTALVLSFIDEGKISLDTKVSDYIPMFAKYSKRYITIRHCLSHFTGIKGDKGIENILAKNKFENLEEAVNAIASKRDIDANPGVEFKYSGIGLTIAARICEIVSKRSFEQLIRQRILFALDMRNTSFAEEVGAVSPSGGAKSSANDLLNFTTMLLNKGMYKGKRVLSETSVAMMQEMQTNTANIKYVPKSMENFAYGFGTWITDTTATGKANVITCPSLLGTLPFVDNCRKYTCVIVSKGYNGEMKRETFNSIKEEIDAAIGNCNN